MINLPSDLAQHLGDHPFDALMNAEGEVYRKQPGRETARITINHQHYFIKKHRGFSLLECFKNWFTGRMPVFGAKPEWLAIQASEKMGLETTPLVAYGQRGFFPWTQESFVLTRALDHCVSLEELCASWQPTLKEKRELIKKIAHITRTLHNNGWVHRDLYLCHFLKDEADELHLIDLHRMNQPSVCKQRWIIKDLAGLLFSSLDCGLTRSDVMCFLKAYGQLSAQDIKKILERATALYLKSHQDYPPQAWMHQGEYRLPKKTGVFHEHFDLGVNHFQSLVALRILPGRRWVLKGYWQDKLAVLKLFKHERDFNRELCGAQALQQHNILTPQILFQGKTNHYFAIVYQYVDHAEPVENLSPELLKTMAMLHEAGLVQTDCHRDNFLQKDSRIYVLDPAGIVSYSKVNEDTALKNLALLFAQWPAREDFDHLLLLPAYVQARLWEDDPLLQAVLFSQIDALRVKGRNAWLKKIFRDCTPIKTKTRFTFRYCTHRDFDTLYTQTLFNYPEAYFHPKANFLKQGNSATVVRTTLGDHDLVIKRFNRKNWIKRLKRFFTPSKAARAWKMSHAMESIGIATPKPLAFIEKRFGPFCLDSYFISEFTPGERLDKINSLSDCSVALNELMDALDLARCQHGDLKASNLIWDGKTLYLLDTDAAKFYKTRRAFQPAHDADWERLLRNWEHKIVRGDDNA